MNDIPGTDIGDHRFVDNNVHLTKGGNGDIILAAWIFRQHAKDVRGIDLMHILFAKDAVFSRIPNIPSELLTDDLDDSGLAFGRKAPDGFAPQRHRHTKQENTFDDGHRYFDVIGGMIAHAEIIGLGITGPMEPEKGVSEVSEPPDEKDDHQ